MSVDETLGGFFKPETRSSGSRLVAQEKVSLPDGSDTSVHAFVKSMPPLRVHLSSEDISSETLMAECSCPAAGKGQLCKHVWAAILCAETKFPDFLSLKKNVVKRMSERPSRASDGERDATGDQKAPSSASARASARESARAAAKERASQYRKEQYQKSKLRAKGVKEKKSGKVSLPLSPSFPPAVEEALAYFSGNGFPMSEGPAAEILSEAKRKLSRVFHPDKGGSHEEIVELNRWCEILWEFLRS